MGLEKNGLDGSGAMDDESRRRIEEDLIRVRPSLRHSPTELQKMVDAIQRGADEGWRPSEAVNSQGDVNDSDVRDMEGFLENPRAMEDFRREHMGNKNIFPETTDPEDERYFGETAISPGEKWLRQIQDPNGPEGRIKEGNELAPTQQRMEQEAESRGSAERPWIRHFPAAGRFAARRTR